ncbi:MAG: aldehyde-activating protein [Ponticaulis sp.]|nr:aldehyde-activating protein [Ponticaulis sp.]
MSEYRASCACGGLKIDCQGDPQAVVQCHCRDCKKRTGSPFGVGIYYALDDVDIQGVSQRYIREAASGAPVEEFFCPTCASTVYWTTERHPGGLGISYGCVEGMDLPPVRTVFEQDRCSWVQQLDIPTFIRGRDSLQVRQSLQYPPDPNAE